MILSIQIPSSKLGPSKKKKRRENPRRMAATFTLIFLLHASAANSQTFLFPR